MLWRRVFMIATIGMLAGTVSANRVTTDVAHVQFGGGAIYFQVEENEGKRSIYVYATDRRGVNRVLMFAEPERMREIIAGAQAALDEYNKP